MSPCGAKKRTAAGAACWTTRRRRPHRRRRQRRPRRRGNASRRHHHFLWRDEDRRQLRLGEQFVQRRKIGVLDLLQLAHLLAHFRREITEHLAVLFGGAVVAGLHLEGRREQDVVELYGLVERALVHVTAHLV